MKVENPRFLKDGGVDCLDCPFCNERGELSIGMQSVCEEFQGDSCPTNETYAEACKMADEMTG